MSKDRTAVPTSMRALRLHERSTPTELVHETAPTPTAGTGDVLVKVKAAGYTPGELDWPSTWVDRAGRDRRPTIPSHEVSGVVADIGFGERRLKAGDEVYGLTDWYRDGAAAEFVAVEARNLAPKPTSMTHLEACTIPLAGLTALQGLTVHGKLQEGQVVLINGAAGGVGALAVQLARAMGARVLAAARAREGEMVTRLGADVFIDLDRGINKAAAAVSLVFDTIGGDGLRSTYHSVVPGGSIVSIVEQPCPDDQSARGVFFVVEPDRAGLVLLASYLDTAVLAPVVGPQPSLARAAETIALKEAGSVQGKIAINVAGAPRTSTTSGAITGVTRRSNRST